MKFNAALVAILLGSSGVGAQCDKWHVRKEFRDMSINEWDAFKSAFLTLQTTQSPLNANYSVWDSFTKAHVDNMMIAHNSALFFPWHRALILVLEQHLQRINPNITLPFWDWTLDWKQPLNSPIMRPEYGIDVTLSSGGDCRYRRQVYKPHCLLRDYNPNNFTSYYAPETVHAAVTDIDDYDKFRRMIEMVPHAIVHTSLGGSKGDMAGMNSPNDPIFYLHHSMVDYIWWIWQERFEDSSYSGDLEQEITPFGIKVSDVINSSRFCRTYQPPSGNAILRPGKNHAKRQVEQSNDLAGGPTVFTVSRRWLSMYHISPFEFLKILHSFDKLSNRPLTRLHII